jgi:NADPH-dependent 2,4-dienoyl-CoA reductase/sulfur reductase-like enzyme
MKNERVIIVGGVAGGATAAARLRRLNENIEIIMFEQGEYISFANCGLPYYIGGEIEKKQNLLLQTPQSFGRRFNVDVRVSNKVIEIDRQSKRVKVKNLQTQEEYYEEYDKLILATGASPVKLFKDAYTVRNIPDIENIKEKIKDAKTAVIIGARICGTRDGREFI